MTYQPKAPALQTATRRTQRETQGNAESVSAEESRQRLIDFLRAITDNLGEGLYALDTTGCLTFMNPAAERMLGWTQAELRGKDMHATIHFQHADGTPFPMISARC